MKFDLKLDDAAITAVMDRTDRAAQNAFKRGLRAALKVFREAAASYASSRHYPDRWTNPNRGYRTSVDTALSFAGPAGPKGKRAPTGFRLIGKLFSKFPGNVYESGQREHWIKMTPALQRWARRRGIPARVLEREGLWITRKPSWSKKKSGRGSFSGKRWFVPFDGPDGARLQAWAKAKGLNAKKALLVHDQPPRPFVVPAAREAASLAREEFNRVIQEWWEASGRA